MSLRLDAKAYPRMPREAYFTPGYGVRPLLSHLSAFGLLSLPGLELWEMAGGAGHIARELRRISEHVFASDIAPARQQVSPVVMLDFLNSTGPSGHHPLGLVTNPPYGEKSALAIAFILHGLELLAHRGGFMALLLPCEFATRPSRNELVGCHPYFAARWTVGKRLRWVNVPQKKGKGPMGQHEWILWVEDTRLRRRIRLEQPVRVI